MYMALSLYLSLYLSMSLSLYLALYVSLSFAVYLCLSVSLITSPSDFCFQVGDMSNKFGGSIDPTTKIYSLDTRDPLMVRWCRLTRG